MKNFLKSQLFFFFMLSAFSCSFLSFFVNKMQMRSVLLKKKFLSKIECILLTAILVIEHFLFWGWGLILF